MMGAAVSVNGPVAAVALCNVNVPVFVAVVAGVVVNAGVGPVNVKVAAVTVKFTPPTAPAGVVTVTARADSGAVPLMTKFAVTSEALVLVMVAVTPPPAVTAVAPDRLVPVIVTATVVPRAPLLGAIDVSVVPVVVVLAASTAPGSKCPSPPVSGRALPKKSVEGCPTLDGMVSIGALSA
jgi:hypothetical protein